MEQNSIHTLMSRLPDLPGGWEVTRYPICEGTDVELFVPIAPDALLDDAEVQERNRFNDAMPYWAWVWDAAPLMARQLVGHLTSQYARARSSQPLRVAEVGAGLGLVGLAIGRALGERVRMTLTDHDELSVQVMQLAALANELSATTTVESLDWYDERALHGQRFDAVFASDVLYEARSHEPLLALLARILEPNGTAWFADPGRARSPGFLARAAARGWTATSHDEAGASAVPEIGQYRLYRLTKAARP